MTHKVVCRTATATQGLLKTKNLCHCSPKLAIHPFSPPEVGVSQMHGNTHRHVDSMTELAQWAQSVKIQPTFQYMSCPFQHIFFYFSWNNLFLHRTRRDG